jgi:tyrosine-specific transport protein
MLQKSVCAVQVIASFLALLARAAGGAEPSALAAADWAAVPATLPTIALAFVYQNVVPVIASSLEVNLCSIPIHSLWQSMRARASEPF